MSTLAHLGHSIQTPAPQPPQTVSAARGASIVPEKRLRRPQITARPVTIAQTARLYRTNGSALVVLTAPGVPVSPSRALRACTRRNAASSRSTSVNHVHRANTAQALAQPRLRRLKTALLAGSARVVPHPQFPKTRRRATFVQRVTTVSPAPFRHCPVLQTHMGPQKGLAPAWHARRASSVSEQASLRPRPAHLAAFAQMAPRPPRALPAHGPTKLACIRPTNVGPVRAARTARVMVSPLRLVCALRAFSARKRSPYPIHPSTRVQPVATAA